MDIIFGRRFLPCQLKVKPNKFLILLVQVGLLSSDNECGMVSHFYLLTIFNSNIFLTNISAYLSYLCCRQLKSRKAEYPDDAKFNVQDFVKEHTQRTTCPSCNL